MLKKITLILASLSLISTCYASADITCYSGGKEIYKGVAKEVGYVPGEYLKFKDTKTNKITFVLAECIIQARKWKDLD